MAAGNGRYNDLCAEVRQRAQATGCLLLILDGNRGNGFEVQAGIEDMPAIVHILRAVADEMEGDLKDRLPEVLATEKQELRTPPPADGKS